ncbi:interferon-related developmental regulator 2 [Thrips palmi]|uniref:Interferon-related developmental regulator 2 n=1 Tax=Thrips palmi TaxID=161013 RepID=A0A6P8YXH9_THRPL|nr:interferon-related developmental regulator 2 [Thrips palmi]
MPKGKRKGKSGSSGQKIRSDGLGITSDEDSLNDNASVFSLPSDTHSVVDEVNEQETDETAIEEEFEERLRDAIDGLSQKSAQGRTQCLEAVSKAFVKRFIPDFVVDRRLTISDGIERCLKKGRGAEQAAAAQLAPLMCVQLGLNDYSEELCRELAPVLMLVARDPSVSPSARSKCCWALGLLTFLAGGEMQDVMERMRALEAIFSGSYLKGDGTMPTVTPETGGLHAAALSAWSLLLTLMAPGDVFMYTSDEDCTYLPKLNQLSELLESAHLEVRLAAGELIALLYEQGRSHDSDFCSDFTEELVGKIRQLATDSHKYRAKKDRKQQRSSFRDILQYVEEDIPPEVQVRFGQEVLLLDSWCRRKQYDAFCQVLGSGMNLHLTENDLLRDVFELGEKLSPLNYAANKQTKQERHLLNAASFKARTISRGKYRDKRSTVVGC